MNPFNDMYLSARTYLYITAPELKMKIKLHYGQPKCKLRAYLPAVDTIYDKIVINKERAKRQHRQRRARFRLTWDGCLHQDTTEKSGWGCVSRS